MARILVIEDNPDNLELMTYLLKAFGHSILAAGDGEQGIETARRERPDLIVCDIHLPGKDGYAVARELKSDTAMNRIRIVAVSALAMVGDHEKGLAAGFDGYISKPIDPETFVDQIDSFLRFEKRGVAPRLGLPGTATKPADSPTKRIRVLVVDDSPTNRELIYQTLTPSGYEVMVANSVKSALELAETIDPELILSDLHMPDEDGFGLIRRIKADPRLARVPFIFISSSVWGERDRETAMRLGVSRFILRPVEPQALIDEVAACLAEHEG
ncbi:MAG TPA: response regulator [Rhodanobacteraceae bacterium]|nr:response regulator [Rhodanobacteraceae bacterium]